MSIRSKFENGGKRSSYGFHTHRNVVFLPRKKKQMKSKEWGNRIKKNVYFTSTARELMAEERAGFKVMFGISLHDFESVKKTC